MKVLGVGDGKYICEVNREEFMAIMGTDNQYDVEDTIGAGTEMDLDRIIKAARWIRNLDTKHMNTVIRELQLTLAGVEKVKQSAVALNLFNKLADDPNSSTDGH